MYVLGALLLLAVLFGSVIAVVNSVLGTVGLSAIINKIPVIGAHWGLLVSIGMIWVLDVDVLGGWFGHFVDAKPDQWIIIVANGAVVYGMIPLKDAVVSMVSRGFRA